MNTEIKKYADSGDIKSLKYIFVDSLDVDPTFVQYEEEYNYCKSIPGLLESHVELTPFKADKTDWDERYWTSLKMDLVKNFSDRRMAHMREVAQVFLADKIQRILTERASHVSVQKTSITEVRPVSAAVGKSAHATPKVTEFVKPTSTSKATEQNRQIEEAKRKLEAENKALANRTARENKEQTAKSDQQHFGKKQTASQNGSGYPKKAIGIALAAVAVAVILILLLK